MFFLTGSSQDPPEAIFASVQSYKSDCFFVPTFYSSPHPAEASALLEMSKSASAFWSLGFLVSGVLHTAPCAPQVSYICSLCYNYSQYGPNACPLEDVMIPICQVFTIPNWPEHVWTHDTLKGVFPVTN